MAEGRAGLPSPAASSELSTTLAQVYFGVCCAITSPMRGSFSRLGGSRLAGASRCAPVAVVPGCQGILLGVCLGSFYGLTSLDGRGLVAIHRLSRAHGAITELGPGGAYAKVPLISSTAAPSPVKRSRMVAWQVKTIT